VAELNSFTNLNLFLENLEPKLSFRHSIKTYRLCMKQDASLNFKSQIYSLSNFKIKDVDN